MTYNKKYSLGIYVNRNMFSSGGSGNPHVFLGLKIEKVKCNDMQIRMEKERYAQLLRYNMLEQAKQCQVQIAQMQCFIESRTLEDLKNELSKKYKYYITSSKNFKAWEDTDLDSKKENFDTTLRETFNKDFTFLRQCYADITEPFFIWVKNIKNINDNYIQTQINFDEFENLFHEFIESQYSNLDSIEGFFGFGPYKTGLFKNYKENEYMTGGKVFQNNHWNDDFEEKMQDEYKKLKDKLKNKPLPRIPFDTEDKQYLIYSKDFTLTTMRSLKTFQESESEVIEIGKSEYETICKSILFQTLLSSDNIRQNAKIFDDTRNVFKNYKVIGNSCVDFVMDKLQLIGASRFDKATTIAPYEVHTHVKDNKPNIYNRQKGLYKTPLSKHDKISYLLQDLNLFYHNYTTLCSIDSAWECERGLKAFGKHYTNIITLDNYIFPLTFKEEYAKVLINTSHLTQNQIPFPFDKEFLIIKQEYTNYQQICSINRDTPLAFNDFKLHIKQDDLARRVNAGIYIVNELEGVKTKMYDDRDNKISLLIFRHEKERFYIANADNDFNYQDFDLSYIDSATNMASYAYAIKGHSFIVADKLKYYGNITQESMRAYIEVMIAKASGKFSNSDDTISIAKAYYTQQEEYNA